MRARVSLSIAAAMASVSVAAAQSPSSDPLESAMIRLGPVGINPAIVVRQIGVDNNIFNEGTDPKSDFTFTLTPRAELLFRPRPLQITYTTAVDYVYYQTYTSERGTNRTSQVRLDLELGRLKPFVSAGGANTRERYNQEVDTRARRSERTYAGGVALQVASRTTLTAAAHRTRANFEEGISFRGEELARAFDSRIDAFDGSVGLQLTPITAVSLVVTQERQRFTFAPERDSDTTRVTPTVHFRPGGLLDGSAAVGYRHFNGRSADLHDFSGLVAIVNIGATIVGRHRLDTTFTRDLRYSYERDTPYYITTGGTATLTTQIAGPFDIRLTGTRQVLDYSHSMNAVNGSSDDSYAAYGGGVGYRARPLLRIGLNVETAHRASDRAADREFRNDRVFATVTWGIPQ